LKDDRKGVFGKPHVVWKMKDQHGNVAVFKPENMQQDLTHNWGGTWIDGKMVPKREVAAYVVSRAMNSVLVPPTVYRTDIMGGGSLQAWIEGDLLIDRGASSLSEDQLLEIAIFTM